MVIGICQFDIQWEDKDNNKEKILSLLNSSDIVNNLDLLIFPEMTLTGFSMNMHKTVLNERDIDFFKNIASKYSLFISFGGVIDRKNSFITLNSTGKIVSDYAKIHLFSHAGEDKVYMPGSKKCRLNISGISIIPFICYDLRFSYLFWQEAMNTDVFVVISNWPLARDAHWAVLLIARAIENQAYVIGVNRVGKDPNMDYAGNSSAVSPTGEQLLDCNDQEGIFCVDIHKELIVKTRNKFPVLADRKE